MQSSSFEMLIEDLHQDRSDFTSFIVRGVHVHVQILLLARKLVQNLIKVIWQDLFGNNVWLCSSKACPCAVHLYLLVKLCVTVVLLLLLYLQ